VQDPLTLSSFSPLRSIPGLNPPLNYSTTTLKLYPQDTITFDSNGTLTGVLEIFADHRGSFEWGTIQNLTPSSWLGEKDLARFRSVKTADS
jgi:hypothetical protein